MTTPTSTPILRLVAGDGHKPGLLEPSCQPLGATDG